MVFSPTANGLFFGIIAAMPTPDTHSHTNEQLAQVKKQLAWYKSFFEHAADAVLIVLPETWSILDANEYAALLLGLKKSDLLGATFPEFRRINKLLIQSSSPTVLSELVLTTPNGNSVMVEVSARFVEHDGQRLIQASARDVTEQRALTDKMVQADKMVLLGQLSAGVAHEIRNPLAAINLNLQMLQRKVKPSTAEAGYLHTALLGVERIVRIVEATLDFSRQSVPETRLENVNDCIRTSIDFAAPTFARKTINIETLYCDPLPGVIADSKQLQQVFINLLTNAADAIRAKGRIIVKTFIDHDGKRGEGRHVVVAIADNGIGVSEEDLTKIFSPFFTRKPDGTGLGLPISQKIIHQHNGVIEVESTVGIGTTFYVKLPVPHEG